MGLCLLDFVQIPSNFDLCCRVLWLFLATLPAAPCCELRSAPVAGVLVHQVVVQRVLLQQLLSPVHGGDVCVCCVCVHGFRASGWLQT